MFVPSEALISAAFNVNPGLHEFALEKSVLIASPVSLLALLRNAALYWQQQTLADGAQEIYDASREMYKRTVTFIEHVETIGKKLARIKVIDKETKNQIGYKNAFIRTVTRLIDSLPIAYILGIIVIRYTEKNQRIGDIISKAIVIKTKIISKEI